MATIKRPMKRVIAVSNFKLNERLLALDGLHICTTKFKNKINVIKKYMYSRTTLIRPPSESHWCGRIRGMVAREGFVNKQKALSVTRNVVV